VKGEIKEAAGKLTKNTDLEMEGKEEKDRRQSPGKSRPDQEGLWKVGERV